MSMIHMASTARIQDRASRRTIQHFANFPGKMRLAGSGIIIGTSLYCGRRRGVEKINTATGKTGRDLERGYSALHRF